MGVYTIFPKRGFVQPSDSLSGGDAAPSEEVFLVLDALVREAPEYQFSPTKSPVEKASTISDHVTQEPLTLTVEGIVSDTPVSLIREITTNPLSDFSPSMAAHLWLEDLCQTKQIFDFVGGFKLYQNMVITRYAPVRDPQTGSALSFTCVMAQLTIVGTEVLPIPKRKGAQPKVSKGAQPAKDANQQQIMEVSGVYKGLPESQTATVAGSSVGGIDATTYPQQNILDLYNGTTTVHPYGYAGSGQY